MNTGRRSIGVWVLVPVLLSAACAQARVQPGKVNQDGAPSAARPKLVVMIVVDQFREPYLERYGDLFTGGFRRLLDRGRFYPNASHDHAMTETAVGHATLSTGTYPMHHGIVANDWLDQTKAGWVDVSNVGDSTTKIVEAPSLPGVSPHYLMRTGLADWIVASDRRAQVASVSGKDRGAVLPAAHVRGNVYWFEPRVGKFVTSTYYRDAYPEWASRFNSETLKTFARDSVWTSTVPQAAASRTSPDTASWEFDRVHTAFPHRFEEEAPAGRYWDWFAATPLLDAATLGFAQSMVTALNLGKGEATDFLNVSLSQTDRVGHAYGPLSREQLDNLLRLDRELGEFFAFLDRSVGADSWVVGLSADHGALLAPETLPQPGESPAGRRATDNERAALKAISDSAVHGIKDPQNAERTAAALRKLPFVADAYIDAQLLRGTAPDSFAVLARRSLYPGRAAAEFSVFGVEVRYVEGWMDRAVGTTHISGYWYDRHVPMLFMGRAIVAARDSSRVSTVDFAPTLGALARVRLPTDLDGRVLKGVIGP